MVCRQGLPPAKSGPLQRRRKPLPCADAAVGATATRRGAVSADAGGSYAAFPCGGSASRTGRGRRMTNEVP